MKPADFPLGSRQSRAAARAILVERQKVYERREVILDGSADEAPHATPWHTDETDQTAGRIVSIPEGMTLAEGLRALGGYSEKELAEAEEFRSEPLRCGTMLVLRR